MTTPQFYLERTKEQLQREIGWTIANDVRDPRIPPVVTITEVKLASDTRNATVYVSVLGEENQKEEAITALNHAAPFIQKIVAAKVSLRHFPRLYFKLDRSLDRSQRISDLLKEVQDDLV